MHSAPGAGAAVRTRARPAWVPILAVAIGLVLVHVAVAIVTPYEFHRDEFLYMAMGRHLRLFAMDFPPLIAILSEAQRGLFGDALWSLRLAPALAHGALVVLTGVLAARFGGGRFAQLLALAAVATAPLFLRTGTLFQPVIFDQLWWTLGLYALVRLADAGDGRPAPRDWLLLGGAMGLGLLTKFTILPFGAGVLVAVLLARREWLRAPGPWLAAALALLIGAPSWIGQVQLGAPVLGQLGDLRETQLERIGYAQFLLELVLMHGPGAFLLAAAGVTALLRSRRFARWRVVGWACLVPFVLILLLRGKPYYVGPVFPTLYAAGASLAGAAAAQVRARRLAQAAAVFVVAAWGIVVLPLGLAILPPEPMARFAAAIGVTSAVRTNQGVLLELPQDYADMLGWERKVERIARVYHGLPAGERAAAVIVADNYGQAGAIDFYGPEHGLPPARAPVGSYWFWGPGEKPGEVVLKVGGERADLEPFCRSIELGARIEEPWVVPEERDLAVWICREPYRTLQEIWPMFRGQN